MLERRQRPGAIRTTDSPWRDKGANDSGTQRLTHMRWDSHIHHGRGPADRAPAARSSRRLATWGCEGGGSRAPYPRPAITIPDVGRGTACADRSRQGEHPGAKVSTAEAATGQVCQRNPGSPPGMSGAHGERCITRENI